MSDVLIRCENVGKIFCRDLRRSLWYGVRDIVSDLTPGRQEQLPASSDEVQLRDQEFWANRDVTFEVRRGECVGLIGCNGAGKTTLLKMLNGLIKPDTGQIDLFGRIGALIALGAGFNPILTGRENIYVNGSILGLSKRQIDDRFEEIVEFSEQSRFIDAPVQSYSSGMKVRLGFAVAAVLLEPDVLLLDEVLAVGDMGFTIKCFNRVRSLANNSAVILVSHTMPQIGAFCSRVCVMQEGQIATDTRDIGHAISVYERSFDSQTTRSIAGSGEAVLLDAAFRSPDTVTHAGDNIFSPEATVQLEVAFEILREGRFTAIVGVNTVTQGLMHLPCTDAEHNDLSFGQGTHRILVSLPVGDLTVGRYRVFFVVRDDEKQIALRVNAMLSFQVVGKEVSWGSIVRPAITERIDSSEPAG